MKSIFEQNGGTYQKVGDYYIPDLAIPENKYEIGKYGRMRLRFIKSERKCLYSYLMTTGKLFEQLHEVDVKAQKIMDCFIRDAEKSAPDKATHQMEWVGYMNNARHSAEEIINQRLIYV